jgi:hypothetical protein
MSLENTTRRVLNSAAVDKINATAVTFLYKEFDEFLDAEGQTVTGLVIDQLDEGFQLEPNSGELVVEVVFFTENYTIFMLVNRSYEVTEYAVEEVIYDDDVDNPYGEEA